MDELAAAAGSDPIDFRLKHMTDPRQISVLQAVKELSGWQTRPSPAARAGGEILRGRGVAQSNRGTLNAIANVAEVEVTRKTGAVRVTRMSVATELGVVVHPDSTIAQIEGGTIMGISRVLKEGVHFGKNRVTDTDWVTYPILRFGDVPDAIDVKIIRRPGAGLPDGGIGEPANNNLPPAIANAIFDATGVRLRQPPFTPARVRAALKAAGVA